MKCPICDMYWCIHKEHGSLICNSAMCHICGLVPAETVHRCGNNNGIVRANVWPTTQETAYEAKRKAEQYAKEEMQRYLRYQQGLAAMQSPMPLLFIDSKPNKKLLLIGRKK